MIVDFMSSQSIQAYVDTLNKWYYSYKIKEMKYDWDWNWIEMNVKMMQMKFNGNQKKSLKKYLYWNNIEKTIGNKITGSNNEKWTNDKEKRGKMRCSMCVCVWWPKNPEWWTNDISPKISVLHIDLPCSKFWICRNVTNRGGQLKRGEEKKYTNKWKREIKERKIPLDQQSPIRITWISLLDVQNKSIQN